MKKDICLNDKPFAYYSGFNGLEINYIEQGANDYIYCTAGAWNGNKSYHKLKIYYNGDDNYYIKLHDYKIPLNECIRM